MQIEPKSVNNKKIRQSNVLVEATYAQEFTVTELKIFEVILSSCKSDDIKLFENRLDKEVSFTRSELSKILNINPSIISQEAHRISSSLMKKYIEIKNILNDGTLEFQQIGIMPYCQYIGGILTVHWNYRLLPFLIEINNNFTEYQLHYLLALGSAYAIKLYKLLYQYKTIKSRIFTVTELKEQFGIKGKYKKYNDFKKDIIEPSVKQISELTNIKVIYNEIKVGRKVEKLEFVFEVKSTKSLESKHSDEIIDIANNIVASNLNEGLETELSSQTKSLITQYQEEKGLEYVDASISYAKKNAKTNFDKYLSDTLTKGWAEVEIKKQTIKKKQVVEKVTATKQANLKKEQDKEQDRLNKSIVESKWNELLDEDKAYHVDYANSILTRYTEKLSSFSTAKQYLPLCIYAVSNQTSYDRPLESYMKHVLNVSLNISDSTL